jgi:hypothetical protein
VAALIICATKFHFMVPAEAQVRLHNVTRQWMTFSAGPRPKRWCGWYMRTQKSGGPEFNLARNWVRYGSPSRPKPGAVVVWRNHVGIIEQVLDQCTAIVRSGNDGGAVRSRPRNICNAIAVRA